MVLVGGEPGIGVRKRTRYLREHLKTISDGSNIWKFFTETQMLPRIFIKALMSVSNKHNNLTFTKKSSASLSHCIENISKHSPGKWPSDALTMAALSFAKSTKGG